jgi:hypothetical protein
VPFSCARPDAISTAASEAGHAPLLDQKPPLVALVQASYIAVMTFRSHLKVLRRAALLLALGLSACAGPGPAGDVATAVRSAIASVTPATQVREVGGDLMVHSAEGEWRVVFISCQDQPCDSVSFFADVTAPRLTLEDVNRLNATMRYVRLSLGDPGRVAMQLDVYVGAAPAAAEIRYLTARWLDALRRVRILGGG